MMREAMLHGKLADQRVRCRLTPVLESLRKIREMGVWVEVTPLEGILTAS
jgi:hypothetical protein